MSKEEESKFWKTRHFQRIHQVWQKKLAEAGFFDIEWHHKSLKSRKTRLSPQQINEKFSKNNITDNMTDAETITSGFQSRFLKNDNARIYNKLREMSPENLYEYIQHRYAHYHAVENFLTHVKLDDPYDDFILRHYVLGATYRQITKELKKWICKYPIKHGIHYSLYWVHTRMQKLLADIMLWNRQHPEGIFSDMHEPSISEYEI